MSIDIATPGPAPTSPAVPIQLTLPGGIVLALEWRDIARDAMLQSYKVRSRRRWAATDADAQQTEPSPLSRLLSDAALRQIANAGIVEVSVPWSDAREDEWAARIMPWEFILSSATRPHRDGPLTVVRRVSTDTPRQANRPLLESALIIESAPGHLAELYDISHETQLVRASLGLTAKDPRVHVLCQPDDRRLRAAVEAREPGLIHFAGFDTHQAANLLCHPWADTASVGDRRDPTALDGLALTLTDGAPAFAPASDIATILNAGERRPMLVSLNVYNSAARVAPGVVAAGAAHAIGFLDAFDDRLAERFFAVLYRRLASDPQAILTAFQDALGTLRDAPKRLRATGVVLWSADPLVADLRAAPRQRAPARERHPAADSKAAAQRIDVICEPRAEMNYSLLHNGRSPLQRFQIIRQCVSGPVRDINVSVTLYVGEESFPYVRSLSMDSGDTVVDLTDQVVVPLTSALMRTQGEKIGSVLAVTVGIGTEIVFRETYRMALAPVDQWSDTDENRLWLPSFVLPRDPVVATLVQSARRYLVAIGDDPSAGFDGYQSVGGPELAFADRFASVDAQVRAIWYALLLERPLLYVNPPPAYAKPAGSDAPQRLRTPSEILKVGHGTCIDLALLLCACLEYVDIWPVVFLLEGHAFPGYWRGEGLHREFQQFGAVGEPAGGRSRSGAVSDRLEASYTVPKDAYLEVKTLVERGHVVPLETVWLTNHSSFTEAMDEGLKNLRSQREFHSMVDLRRARDEGVAPLPIVWRSA